MGCSDTALTGSNTDQMLSYYELHQRVFYAKRLFWL